MELTIQMHVEGAWDDCATLRLPHPERGTRGPARLTYRQAHAEKWIFRDDIRACSLLVPVELMLAHRSPHWFGFLEDILPSGAARRYWMGRLGIEHLAEQAQDAHLLAKGAVAPIGNLRVREAVEALPRGSAQRELRFPLASVVDRDVDFLEMAHERGAAAGGATGAGGEAPKLLLRVSLEDEVWIDAWQEEAANPDRPMLVKFPRGRRTDDDCDLLRAEFHFTRELADLGVDTVAPADMRLIEGRNFPSLWLPRFDREWRNDAWVHLGMESVTSLMGAAPGAFLDQGETVRRVVNILGAQHRVRDEGESFDHEAFVVEWVRRDFLNVAFGNSDNHGRNAALLKRPEGVWLSPVFDFAPMRMDPEGVVRTLRWAPPLEAGGTFDWHAIARELGDLTSPDRLIHELEQIARRLVGLADRLEHRGVPQRALTAVPVGLAHLEARLKRWGLT